MKRYDTVYFWHKTMAGRTVCKSAIVVAINPDTIIVRPRGGDKIMVLDKDQVVTDKNDLPVL